MTTAGTPTTGGSATGVGGDPFRGAGLSNGSPAPRRRTDQCRRLKWKSTCPALEPGTRRRETRWTPPPDRRHRQRLPPGHGKRAGSSESSPGEDLVARTRRKHPKVAQAASTRPPHHSLLRSRHCLIDQYGRWNVLRRPAAVRINSDLAHDFLCRLSLLIEDVFGAARRYGGGIRPPQEGH